jgi:hypothetical protein
MDRSNQSNVLFRETQWFQPRWLWVLVMVTAAASWFLPLRHTWRQHPWLDIASLACLVFFGIGAPMFLVLFRQTTEVRADGIHVSRGPFPATSEFVRFSQFFRYQPRACSPIYSAGGWGIAEGWQGKAYNMGGSHGVEFCMVGGGRILIGTTKMRQLLDALHSQCRGKIKRPAPVTEHVGIS